MAPSSLVPCPIDKDSFSVGSLSSRNRKPVLNMRRQFGFWQVFAPAKLFWLIALAALILIRLLLPRSPLPWFDEIFLASAALSMAHGGAAVPSVLGAFPHTGSVNLFYGPFG